MIRVGIIGYGKMGILHGALANGSHKAKVTAVCDKSWVMRYGIKKAYPGVKVFADAKEMLQKVQLDAVIVTTPTFDHARSALLSIEKNCNLLIEKPLASEYEDARRIYRQAVKKGVKVQVGFCNRFAPSIAKGKELLDAQVIGKATDAKAWMYIGDVLEAHSGWRYNKAVSGGGVLMDFGIHMLDQLCWYFGRIQSVSAKAEKIYSKEVEDELYADFLFANGVHAALDTSWSREAYRKSYARLEILGTAGKMVVTDQTLDIYDQNDVQTGQYVYPDLYDGTFADVGGLLYSRQMEAFLDVLEGKREPNLKSALYTQKAVREIYKSADTGIRVLVGNKI